MTSHVSVESENRLTIAQTAYIGRHSGLPAGSSKAHETYFIGPEAEYPVM